ncbi:MAG TPA: 2-C-methyl-D-erythritol 2,4-cyclodiphosphate synthase, partial [Anaerolineae bacterium]|nr:2-C-methyl-D-erythritol 2,4-cyclodiphosphate synthase [Anaerolineae bacterium]
LREAGFTVGNVDVTIVAQAPRLAPYIELMRAHIAEDLGLAAGAVSVKATTTEHMGFTGRGEGVAAFAIALVK